MATMSRSYSMPETESGDLWEICWSWKNGKLKRNLKSFHLSFTSLEFFDTGSKDNIHLSAIVGVELSDTEYFGMCNIFQIMYLEQHHSEKVKAQRETKTLYIQTRSKESRKKWMNAIRTSVASLAWHSAAEPLRRYHPGFLLQRDGNNTVYRCCGNQRSVPRDGCKATTVNGDWSTGWPVLDVRSNTLPKIFGEASIFSVLPPHRGSLPNISSKEKKSDELKKSGVADSTSMPTVTTDPRPRQPTPVLSRSSHGSTKSVKFASPPMPTPRPLLRAITQSFRYPKSKSLNNLKNVANPKGSILQRRTFKLKPELNEEGCEFDDDDYEKLSDPSTSPRDHVYFLTPRDRPEPNISDFNVMDVHTHDASANCADIYREISQQIEAKLKLKSHLRADTKSVIEVKVASASCHDYATTLPTEDTHQGSFIMTEPIGRCIDHNSDAHTAELSIVVTICQCEHNLTTVDELNGELTYLQNSLPSSPSSIKCSQGKDQQEQKPEEIKTKLSDDYIFMLEHVKQDTSRPTQHDLVSVQDVVVANHAPTKDLSVTSDLKDTNPADVSFVGSEDVNPAQAISATTISSKDISPTDVRLKTSICLQFEQTLPADTCNINPRQVTLCSGPRNLSPILQNPLSVSSDGDLNVTCEEKVSNDTGNSIIECQPNMPSDTNDTEDQVVPGSLVSLSANHSPTVFYNPGPLEEKGWKSTHVAMHTLTESCRETSQSFSDKSNIFGESAQDRGSIPCQSTEAIVPVDVFQSADDLTVPTAAVSANITLSDDNFEINLKENSESESDNGREEAQSHEEVCELINRLAALQNCIINETCVTIHHWGTGNTSPNREVVTVDLEETAYQ